MRLAEIPWHFVSVRKTNKIEQKRNIDCSNHRNSAGTFFRLMSMIYLIGPRGASPRNLDFIPTVAHLLKTTESLSVAKAPPIQRCTQWESRFRTNRNRSKFSLRRQFEMSYRMIQAMDTSIHMNSDQRKSIYVKTSASLRPRDGRRTSDKPPNEVVVDLLADAKASRCGE